MENKLREYNLKTRLQEILELIEELKEKYDIAIDNTWTNHYKILLKINEEIKEYDFTTYKDMLNALQLLKESEK